ncbi:hypothetical protein B0I35DRAFT_404214 [Stachybotrys elegans]|uniref:Uncharacterized protein n=1 Tax=Stachybotrys elegans TaxID=80388 RepID=A0A8K0WYI0_9HYPO|nr:hypothetical protein B0I35DRAFT_404214 [Stachybotrys elegans]
MDARLTLDFLQTLLPSELVDTLQTHVLQPEGPARVVKDRVVDAAWRAYDVLALLLQPLLDRVLQVMGERQDLVGLLAAVLLVTTLITVLTWVHRLIMWGTRMLMRMAFAGLLFAFVAWIWQRGVFESARDGAVLAGRIAGYMAVLKDVWIEEYNRYEAQQTMTKVHARR